MVMACGFGGTKDSGVGPFRRVAGNESFDKKVEDQLRFLRRVLPLS